MADFFHLKPGDQVLRLLGERTMLMGVREVHHAVLVCDALYKDNTTFPGGWEFDRKTGIEEDPELGWGVEFGKSGSRLIHPEESMIHGHA